MLRIFTALLLSAVISMSHVFGQSAGDFRSFQSGDWNNVNTWERFDGATWVNPAPSTPTSADGVITIQAGHNVTVASSVATDQTTIDIGGTVTINSGMVFTVNAGSGDDLTINGELINDGSLTIFNDPPPPPVSFAVVQVNGTISSSGAINNSATTRLFFNAGSTYNHEFTTLPGSIPLATWDIASTCSINGYTTNTSAPTNLNQTFGNFVWNTPNQDASAFIELGGALTTVNGNLEILASPGYVYLTLAQNETLAVGGDFVIASEFGFTDSSIIAITIGGDMEISGGFNFLNNTGTVSLDIAGNLTISGGTQDFAFDTGNTTINLGGSLFLTGGTITRTGTGTQTVTFDGSVEQNFADGATVSTLMNFIVSNSAILNLGTSALTGSGNLTVASTGSLRVGSTHSLGAIQTGTSNGNIRLSGTRTYSAGCTIEFNGVAAQVTGNGLPTDVNIIINNASGVTMNNDLTISTNRTLTLTSGSILSIGANTLTINGSYNSNNGGGTLTGGSSSNLTINGTGDLEFLNLTGGSGTLNTFTVNRSGGTVFLNSDLTVTNSLVNSTGTLWFFGWLLSLQGGYTTGGQLFPNSNSRLEIANGSGTLQSIGFASGSELRGFYMRRPSATSAINGTVTIATDLVLEVGGFDNSGATLTMGTASTIYRTDGTMTTAPGATTSYNVVYQNTSAISTGVELPTGATQLAILSKAAGAGTVTLSTDITVNSDLFILAGTFDAGSHTITMNGVGSQIQNSATATFASSTFIFAGTTTFIGPNNITFGNITVSGTFTPNFPYGINGNLINNGTLGVNSVTFGGTTAITGANASSFDDMTISGSSSVTAPSATTLTVQGSFVNGGTYNANGGTLRVGTASIADAFTNNGTFTTSTGTVTFDGNITVGGLSTTNFSNITINGSLTPPSTLNVSRNFTNDGTFSAGSGTVVFNGTVTQLILGSAVTTFNNMTINNPGGPPGVRVASDANLAGILTVSDGSTFDADGGSGTAIFTLLSASDSPTSDASIAALGTGVVDGNVTVQRYMSIEGPNNTRIYRYISSPVQNATVADFQNEIPVTGSFTGTSSCSGCTTNQSMWTYNESITTGDLNTGFEDFPVNSNTETFQPGVGYTTFVRGNVLGSPVWDLRGPINSGTINLGVTFNSSGVSANDGWNMVGNPYPSTIDWEAAGWTKTNLTSTIYMRDNAAGQVATWNGSTGTNGGSQYIATGQGFWVQTDAAAPSLIATESVKVPGTSTDFIREKNDLKDMLRVTLVQGSKRDETVIHFREDASTGYDRVDAWKWKNNSTFNLSSRTLSGLNLAINSLPVIDCSSAIKLDVNDVTPGDYALEFSQFDSFDPSVNIKLNDTFTHRTFDIRSGASYSFAITSDTASFGSNRFTVTFGLPEIDPQFSPATEDVCTGSNAIITLAASKQGINYSVLANGQAVADKEGTGSGISLVVPDDKLVPGQNSLVVRSYQPTCSTVSAEKEVTVDVIQIPQVDIVSSSAVCQAGAATLEVSGVADGAGYYKWYDSETSVQPITDQTNNVFATPVLQKSKTYYVSGVNSLGCESNRIPVKAEVVHFDTVQISQENPGVLRSSYAEGNQWYFEGEIIPGAVAQEYMPSVEGVYSVEVQLDGGCKTTADATYRITGIEDDFANRIKVHPNPVVDVLTVAIPKEMGVRESIIINSLGQEMGRITFKESDGQMKGEFDMRGKPSGFYLLKLNLHNGGNVNFNLIKK